MSAPEIPEVTVEQPCGHGLVHGHPDVAWQRDFPCPGGWKIQLDVEALTPEQRAIAALRRAGQHIRDEAMRRSRLV